MFAIVVLFAISSAQPHDAQAIADFLKSLEHETMANFDAFARKALPVVRAADDPNAVRHLAKLMFVNDQKLLLADALHHRPHDPALWKELESDYDPQAMATFGPVRIADGRAAMRAEWTSLTDSDITAGAARQIEGLSLLGRAGDVMIAFHALPDAVRKQLLGDDERLDIALAALIAGEQMDIQRTGFHDFRSPGKLTILDLLRRSDAADTFDSLADILGHGYSYPYPGLWSEAVARIAERGGYGRLACEIRERAAAAPMTQLHGNWFEYLPPSMRDELRATSARVSGPVACSQASSTSSTIDRLLSQPPLARYTEKPLDAAARPPSPAAAALPRGFYVVRAERDGDNIVAIGADQRSHTGYWIFRSSDNGLSWEKPLYSGIRFGSPYSVEEHPKQTMLAGDHLDVEVHAIEWDPPNLGAQLYFGRKTRDESVVLEIPWATLTRDSDGDGVTDLEEQLLVTDWTDAASFPHPPSPKQTSIAGEAIAAVLRHRQRDSGLVLISGDRAAFADVPTKATLTVLTPDEWKRYIDKLGLVQPMLFKCIFVSADGTKAFMIVDEWTSHDAYLVTKNGDGWDVKSIETTIA